MEATVQRTYLFVPPEEKSEAMAQGAHWDADSKRCYIDSDDISSKFSRWLSDAEDTDGFTITSTEGYVAAARVPCQRCQTTIEVICIHCESGAVSGEPLTQFTISDVRDMDDALAHQLRAWPNYRKVDVLHPESRYFANHCPACGSLQDDMYLHSEPDQPFFDIPRAEPGSIKLTALSGAIELSGDEHFEIE